MACSDGGHPQTETAARQMAETPAGAPRAPQRSVRPRWRRRHPRACNLEETVAEGGSRGWCWWARWAPREAAWVGSTPGGTDRPPRRPRRPHRRQSTTRSSARWARRARCTPERGASERERERSMQFNVFPGAACKKRSGWEKRPRARKKMVNAHLWRLRRLSLDQVPSVDVTLFRN